MRYSSFFLQLGLLSNGLLEDRNQDDVPSFGNQDGSEVPGDVTSSAPIVDKANQREIEFGLETIATPHSPSHA
jgi:hypothetical protein